MSSTDHPLLVQAEAQLAQAKAALASQQNRVDAAKRASLEGKPSYEKKRVLSNDEAGLELAEQRADDCSLVCEAAAAGIFVAAAPARSPVTQNEQAFMKFGHLHGYDASTIARVLGRGETTVNDHVLGRTKAGPLRRGASVKQGTEDEEEQEPGPAPGLVSEAPGLVSEAPGLAFVPAHWPVPVPAAVRWSSPAAVPWSSPSPAAVPWSSPSPAAVQPLPAAVQWSAPGPLAAPAAPAVPPPSGSVVALPGAVLTAESLVMTPLGMMVVYRDHNGTLRAVIPNM